MSIAIGALAEHCLLDPARVAHAAVPLLAPTMRGLLHADRSNEEPALDLASWHKVSSDGTTHVFGLRPASFHDGTPVRASDVARSLARLVAPGSTASPARTLRGLLWRGGPARDGDPVESITADDRRGAVAIQLAAPFASFSELLSHPCLGIVRERADGAVVGCGPLRPVAEKPGSWRLVPHRDEDNPRLLRQDLSLRAFDSVHALQEALRRNVIDAAVVDRKHYPRFEMHASTPLRDRWVGAMMLNAGGTLEDIELRRDFARVVHAVAAGALPPASRTRLLLPEGLAIDEYYQGAAHRLPSPITAREFSNRWRSTLEPQPLRIVLAPGRGPLTHVMQALIDALVAAEVPLHVIVEPDPAGVYALVDQGAVDVSARGWAQDFDDAEEFFGIYRKQAPCELAQAPVRRFAARVSAVRHADARARLLEHAEALLEIESTWLCVPFCRDTNRLFHAPGVHVNAHGRDTFKLADLDATASAIRA